MLSKKKADLIFVKSSLRQIVLEKWKELSLLDLMIKMENKLNEMHLKQTLDMVERVSIESIDMGWTPCNLSERERKHLSRYVLWGKARNKTLHEIFGEKRHVTIYFKYGLVSKQLNYGDDPFEFELKKWCDFMSPSSEEESEVGDFDIESLISLEKCPVYLKLKKKEKGNKSINISKKDLWHFSEFFHGDLRGKPMCEAKECRQFNRLANGGHAMEDLAHTLVFRHRLGREGSMLNKMGQLNPIVFVEDWDKATAREPRELLREKNEDVSRFFFSMHLFAKHQIESVVGIAWLGASQKSETPGITIIRKKNKIPWV